jgi:chromosome partitioning protein
LDIWTLEKVAQLVQDIRAVNPALRAYTFLNRADPAGPDNEEAAEVLREASELVFLATPIIARKAFGKAAAQGLAVTELKPPDEKAIQEVRALFDRVFQRHRTAKWSGHER